MKLANLTIKDLFTEGEKLSFLVGAGCSIDAPSCLPTGREMMKEIIKYTCSKSEIDEILNLMQSGRLRFEQLIEIFQDSIDHELKLIDYYGMCKKPNLQHFFLANMIERGHFVMTTNFDFLIEYALIQSDIPKENIIPVITKEDFQKYNNPYELFRNGKKTIYKIHGSTKNIITNENTRDSLITTIQALGKNKEGLNIFQLEPFKKTLFDKITKDRTLVILGYSGSDDFDIVPTLKSLTNINTIIWVDHLNTDRDLIKIFEINVNNENISHNSFRSDKVFQILSDITEIGNAEKVFLVRADSLNLISKLIQVEPKISLSEFSVNLMNWLKQNVKILDEIDNLIIPFKIYYELNEFDKIERILERFISQIKILKNPEEKISLVNAIGWFYFEKGDIPKALKSFQISLKISEKNKLSELKPYIYDGIGSLYERMGNFSKALEYYDKVFSIILKLRDKRYDYRLFDDIIFRMGKICYFKEKYDKALIYFNENLKIAESSGNLHKKAISFTSIGSVLEKQKKYDEALEYFEKSLEIHKKLSAIAYVSSGLNNIGIIYHRKHCHNLAMEYYDEAINLCKRKKYREGLINSLNNKAWVYFEKEEYDKALSYQKQSIKLAHKMNLMSEKASSLQDIGRILFKKKLYPLALVFYDEALKILVKLRREGTPEVDRIKLNIRNIKDYLDPQLIKELLNKEKGQLIRKRYLDSILED